VDCYVFPVAMRALFIVFDCSLELPNDFLVLFVPTPKYINPESLCYTIQLSVDSIRC
jgi:hypothetical protein